MAHLLLYKTKPVTITAWLWEGGPAFATPIINWILEGGGTAHWDEEHEQGYTIVTLDDSPNLKEYKVVPEGIYIQTLEGVMKADVGDYIIRGLRGEFYPCKPDVFAQKYELA